MVVTPASVWLVSLRPAVTSRVGGVPMAVASLAVLSGTSHSIEPAETMAALADMVSLADVSRSAAKFNPDDLRPLNGDVLMAVRHVPRSA